MGRFLIHRNCTRLSNAFLVGLFFILAVSIPGHAATQKEVPAYPHNPDAKKHYDFGDKQLRAGRYDEAIKSFEQSIQIEPIPFLSHANLATAFYASRRFDSAASEYSKVLELWGGAEKAPPFAIMQALSLMRSGKTEAAEKLLRAWTRSSIRTDASGAVWYSGGGLSGWWKIAAEYLLGDVSEEKAVGETGEVDKSFAYLFVGINNAIRGNVDQSKKYFLLTMEATKPGQWRHTLAEAEIKHLEKSGSSQVAGDRSLPKMIYDDCMSVFVNQLTQEKEERPEIKAHYFCSIVAGICRDEPGSEECKKGIRGYDGKRGDSSPSELYKASEAGNTTIVNQLLGSGFDPNAPLKRTSDVKDPNAPQAGLGWTPLMIATAEGHTETVRVLLDAGAEPNAQNNLGRTPLMYASNYGFTPIAKLLLAKGANPNVAPNDDNRWTALMVAARKGYTETVRVLLAHGADKSLRDKNGNTALALAEAQGHSEVVRILTENGTTR